MKKTLAVLIVFILCCMPFAALSGCGLEAPPNTATDIEIFYWNSGLGVKYLKKIIADFEAEYTEYKVHLEYSADISAASQKFGLGERYDSVDLYLAPYYGTEVLIQHAEPLNSVVESKYKDEELTIGQKFSPSLLSLLQNPDGNYYKLTYGGGLGFLAYNADYISDEEVPLTTNDLLSLSSKLVSEGKKAFMNWKETSYWSAVYDVWQIQHEGLDYYYNTFSTLDDGNPDTPTPSKEVLKTPHGRGKVLELMQQLVTPTSIVPGSNTIDFDKAQQRFIDGEGAMMANGSWLMNEMSASTVSYEFKPMKTPVISSIVDRCENIKGEAELKRVIRAVDAAGDDINAISADLFEEFGDDVAIIYQARNLMRTNCDEHTMFIPNYSTAKEGALKFLQYYYSDAALNTYFGETKIPIPITLSDGKNIQPDANDSAWVKQLSRLNDVGEYLFRVNANTSKIFTATGIYGNSNYVGINFVSLFSASNPVDRKDASEVWAMLEQRVDSQWKNMLADAGYPAQD